MKFERVEGILKPCEKMAYDTGFSFLVGKRTMLHKEVTYCPFCGADIRSPEPIIRKSGETWAKRENGIDYLWMRPDVHVDCNTEWKPFSEIEITDEIAHLHPVVVGRKSRYCSTLLYVSKTMEYEYVVLEPSDCINRFKGVRLATVNDLED